MNTMHQRHRSFQLLMPIFSEKWRRFVAVNVFANHVYNVIKWGKSSQNAVKQRIEDRAKTVQIFINEPAICDAQKLAQNESGLPADALRYKNSHFQNEGKCKLSLV